MNVAFIRVGPFSTQVAFNPAAASWPNFGCPDAVTVCTACVGGPARKSIVAPTSERNARHRSLAVQLQSIRISVEVEHALVQITPRNDRTRCTPSRCACARMAMSFIVTFASSGTVTASFTLGLAGRVLQVDRMAIQQPKPRLAQQRDGIRHRTADVSIDDTDLVRAA